ncbi:TSL-kinase interacting protein, partial [Trifolium medium]|nr:TSL-kinase interacting protein [Trifolium medium]
MGQSTLASHMSSIWDAEETRDAFSFKKDLIRHDDGPCLSLSASLDFDKNVPERSFENLNKLSLEKESLVDDVAQTDPMPMDNCESGADIKYHLAKDFNGLADMYW